MKNRVPIQKTAKNHRVVWERGGGRRVTGTALLIANHLGGQKVPVYVNKAINRSCGNHALLPIYENDYVCSISRMHNVVHIRVSKVIGFVKEQDKEYAEVQTTYEFKGSPEDIEKKVWIEKTGENLFFGLEYLPLNLLPLVKKAVEKVFEKHCMTAKYVRIYNDHLNFS